LQTKKLININENAEEVLLTITGNQLPLSLNTFPKSMLLCSPISDTVRGYVSLQNIDKENAFSDLMYDYTWQTVKVALEMHAFFNKPSNVMQNSANKYAQEGLLPKWICKEVI
jgi:hypothetical protein